MNTNEKRQLLRDRVGPVEVNLFDGGETLTVTAGDGHRERFTHEWGDPKSAEDLAIEYFLGTPEDQRLVD